MYPRSDGRGSQASVIAGPVPRLEATPKPLGQNRSVYPVLSSASPIPLYFQLSQLLRERIHAGEFDNQKPLPTEDKLSADYGVSRTTVRQAMADLSSQRLIVRRRGLGTFVAESSNSGRHVILVSSIHQALHYVKGFTYAHLSKKEIVPPPDIAERLQIREGETAYLIQAVGMVEKEPLVYANLYFPQRFGKLLNKEDFTSGTPLVRLLEKRIGANMLRAQQIVDPDKADSAVAQALGIPRGTAILRFIRVFYLADGTPLEVAVTRYHPQRYKLEIELLERPPPL